MNCHTEISESTISAELSNPSQGLKRLCSPKIPRKPLLMPQSGLRISCQINPTSTTDNIVGRKKMVRYVLRPKSRLLLNKAASRRPIGFCTSV